MKQIYVCVKHVPDSAANITIVDHRQIKEDIAFLLNPYDEHALTEAVKIKRQFDGAQVIALCLGKKDAEKTIRSAMAMGADKGVLIEAGAIPDSIRTARALKSAMDRFGAPDIIFTGKESIDAEGMQTMFRIGALYGFPVANNVVRVEIQDKTAVVDSELSGGIINTYEMSLPCVIGAGRGLNTPKYPTFKDVMASKRKPVDTVRLDELEISGSDSGVKCIRLESLTRKRDPKEIKGDKQTIAQKIVTILKEEAKVI